MNGRIIIIYYFAVCCLNALPSYFTEMFTRHKAFLNLPIYNYYWISKISQKNFLPVVEDGIYPFSLFRRLCLTCLYFLAKVFILGRPEQVCQKNVQTTALFSPKWNGQICGFLPEWFIVWNSQFFFPLENRKCFSKP